MEKVVHFQIIFYHAKFGCFGAMEVLFSYFICWNQLGNWKGTRRLKNLWIVNWAQPLLLVTRPRSTRLRYSSSMPRACPDHSAALGFHPVVLHLPPAAPRACLTLLPLSLPLLSRVKQNTFSPSWAPKSPSCSTVASAPCAVAASPASRRATTGEAVHTCLLHLHEWCCSQATIHHKPRPKHAVVVCLYGYLSDGRPPPTLVSAPQDPPQLHDAPWYLSRHPPPPLRPAISGAPPPSRAVMEELPRWAPSSSTPSNQFTESPPTSSHRHRPPIHQPQPDLVGHHHPSTVEAAPPLLCPWAGNPARVGPARGGPDE
jgi:hypothetical protein